MLECTFHLKPLERPVIGLPHSISHFRDLLGTGKPIDMITTMLVSQMKLDILRDKENLNYEMT